MSSAVCGRYMYMGAMSLEDRSAEERPRLDGRSDEERDFGCLVEGHRNGLECYCRLMLGACEAGRQAAGEAILRGWVHRGQIASAPSLRTWLYRHATAVCMEQIEDPTPRHEDA